MPSRIQAVLSLLRSLPHQEQAGVACARHYEDKTSMRCPVSWYLGDIVLPNYTRRLTTLAWRLYASNCLKGATLSAAWPGIAEVLR